jgi:riboflavin synthase
MVPKGSVAVDGVSLTVVDVAQKSFSVCLIPETLRATTLGYKTKGDSVNIEADVIGKYVRRYFDDANRRLQVMRPFSLQNKVPDNVY